MLKVFSMKKGMSFLLVFTLIYIFVFHGGTMSVLASNLLTNGDFASGTNPWGLTLAYLAFRIGSNNTAFYIDNVVIDSGKLTWTQPILVNPVTINLTATNNVPSLKSGVDYIIKLPIEVRQKVVDIDGGRNVVIIGGQVQISNRSSTTYDTERKAFYVRTGDPGRIVHIEGCLVTTDTTGEGDGIAINAPESIVQIENCRIEHLKGAMDTTSHTHSDIIQPWGGVKELRVDHLTGLSNYQGFQLPANYNSNGRFIFKNVNLVAEEEWFNGAKGGYMLWLDQSGAGVPTEFENFYIQPRQARSLDKSVWPDKDASDPNDKTALYDNYLTWPNLSYIVGGIFSGSPSAGDFVPAGKAGIGYSSPGYN